MKKIDIYTGVMCGYCDAAKHLLKKKKLEFNEINIATDPEKMDEMLKRSKNARTVPQIFIGDTHVGGYQELRDLEKKGELFNLVK
jgi:glutaredoxin 3